MAGKQRKVGLRAISSVQWVDPSVDAKCMNCPDAEMAEVCYYLHPVFVPGASVLRRGEAGEILPGKFGKSSLLEGEDGLFEQMTRG